MNFLRNYLDKQKPKFEEGGKLHKLHSVFTGFESFLFVPNRTTTSGCNIRDAVDLKRTMIIVVIALIPALLFGIYNVGYQHFKAIGSLAETGFFELFFYGLWRVLPMIIVSYVVGLGIEFAVAQIRGHEINEGFLVSGLLIPLIMPVNAPLWMIAVSTAFAVIIGKEIFGGTGMNIWNPALLARAFFFFSYPSMISGDKVWIAGMPDGFSQATPLAQAAQGTPLTADFSTMFWGLIPGSIGETSTFCILLGAILLIATGIGSWKIMLSTFIGGFCMAYLLNLTLPETNPYAAVDAIDHLVMGGFAFGAVFMATDPVTSAQTEKGKWIYGFILGVMAILIRTLNPGYPEGMMLAILLMNTFAPLIDWFVVQGNIKRRLKRAKVMVD
ncbi:MULTISPECIES: NADH:ubiquinone reductase (Na(+)-transporting) subunit B [Porphyromonadaceae]|uniref:Na(+)-translocating NADH-quinone reductase subunit B n=1 Tax=Sanguibacteroides justesenii TaxID=1547597 RepID=A0A0C3NDC4_9PORP|nr:MULTISPECIES: NADH:ubiquinone reductase (Na(+)-transporting) subunit B [Porphyromonadaceae]KIO44097.1 Na(+)-translocating NADH-quinone reductase subunit B [Sanguibacteroides justesenii]KIO47245.1 Na(+)-translocating NADH-quinone reductase subunit B [Sanguibacteroides justesenii]MCR9012615.1 NADH:ubiquinone reductase (Na(+)-transporting) subunit B [Gabonibacter chumensis]PXZ43868.1 NADH:ubiquinone reductase (Na(+)-transporting) subunit B [Sanguibacteroides justesenii]